MKVAPLPQDERERLEALREYELLDSDSEKVFDEIAVLASFICDTPISTITLIDEKRQWFKAKVGLPDNETSRDVAFCAHAIHTNDIMIVNDATRDDRFFDNPLVTDKPDIRFYAGMPLITPSGYKLGTLCVIDTKPKNLDEKQIFALNVLSKQVMKLFELRKKNMELQRIHETQNKLLSIIGHDLRSPIGSIDGMLLLAEKYELTRQEYQELIPRMRQLVDTTQQLLTNLLHWAKSNIAGKNNLKEQINFKAVTQEIIAEYAEAFKAKNNNVVNLMSDEDVAFADRNRIQFVMRNLMLNANKFTENGNITISCKKLNDFIQISIADTGMGINEEIQHFVFSWDHRKSKDGTKGEKGSGLGLPMSKEFIEQQGGDLWFTTEAGKGTTFFLTLPLEIF
jgi:K+-sensing histidine kinase KdpD